MPNPANGPQIPTFANVLAQLRALLARETDAGRVAIIRAEIALMERMAARA